MNFEIFITNVQGANKIKDFTRDEYIKSINYFEKIYGSYKIDDFYSFYKKALQEMEISHNTGLQPTRGQSVCAVKPVVRWIKLG